MNMVYLCDGIEEERSYSHTKMNVWLNRMDGPSEKFKNRIHDILRILTVMSHTKELNHYLTKVKIIIAPVEFAFIGEHRLD